MPPVSQAQRRWAYATAEGKTSAPPSVGREFEGHGIKGLPERVKATPRKKVMAFKKKRVVARRKH